MEALKRMLGVGWLMSLFFLLSGCMLFAPPAGTPERVSGQSASLSPLSESSQTALREQALSSPTVQAVLQKLRQRGWQEVQNQETSFAFEKARILVMPFAKISPQDQGDQTSPLLTKPRSLEETQPPPASRLHPQPKPPSEPPSLAYLMYVIAPEGEEAFAVLKESESDFLHLYPDADRRLRLLAGGETLLAQLRQNERFRKFEAHLKTYVEKVACGPVVFDEANNIAYIFVQGLSSPLSTWSLAPAVYPPPSSYVPQEGCVYLLLAKVTSAATDSLTFDPQSLWLSPYAMKNGILAGESPVTIATSAVQLLAGGKKPSAWANSRSFAYTVLVPSPHLQPEPTVSPRHSMVLEPPAVQTLVAFIWGLADYPEDNVLYLFKTEAELTIEAYNLAVKHGIPMGLGVHRGDEEPSVALINFTELSLEKVQNLYQLAVKSFTMLDQGYLTFSFSSLRHLFEDISKTKLEDILVALYMLAEADVEGRFDQAYEELLPKGLAGLRTLFESVHFRPEERYRQLMRRLAISWKAYIDGQLMSQKAYVDVQWTPNSYSLLREIFKGFVEAGLARLLDTLIALVKGNEDILRVVTFVNNEYHIPTEYGVKVVGPAILDWAKYVAQLISHLPPPPVGHTSWTTWLSGMKAYIFSQPLSYGLPLIALLGKYHALLFDVIPEKRQAIGITEVEAVRIALCLARVFDQSRSYDFHARGVRIEEQNWRNPEIFFVRKSGIGPQQVNDRVVVRYTDKISEDAIKWAETALDKLVQREEIRSELGQIYGYRDYLNDRAWCRGGSEYGVDVVAVVLKETLDVHSIRDLLEKIKSSELYKKWAQNTEKVQRNASQTYMATACVFTWTNKVTGGTEYVWLDFGPEETPQSVRDDVVRAISGLMPHAPVQQRSLSEPVVAMSNGVAVQSVTGQRTHPNPIWEPPPIYPVWQR